MRFMKLAPTLISIGLLMAACNDSNPPPAAPPPNPNPLTQFTVTVTNLTNAQPLSPAAVTVHEPTFRFFDIGAAASPGLETLAEGGDNTDLIAEADARSDVFTTSGGAGPIGPGSSEGFGLTLAINTLSTTEISVATMLVNTNDAFTGVSGVSLAGMNPGDSIQLNGIAYDAGTEANTEAAVTIPGPAGGGEGFNAARDDRADMVTMHPGVVTADDGLAGSGLGEQHRFLNPVARIQITRVN